MINFIGLTLIVIGWGYQAYYTSPESRVIRKNFLLLYVTGSTLLVVHSLMFGLNAMTLLNAATALLASLSLIKLGSKTVSAPKAASKPAAKAKRRK